MQKSQVYMALVYIIAVETKIVLYFHPCILETLYLRTCIHQALVYIIVVKQKAYCNLWQKFSSFLFEPSSQSLCSLIFIYKRCLNFTADILPTLKCLLAAKQLLKTLCIFFIIDSPLKHHVSDGCKSLAKKSECKVKCVLEVILKRETPNPL